MNTLLFFITVIVTFGGVTLVSKFFGKNGLFAWLGMSVVVANILVCKCVDLFGLSATLGNVLFGSVFLVTDILTERFGVRTAKQAVWVGLSFEIISLVLIQIALLFIPNELDTVQSSMSLVFGLFPRTIFASITMFIFSNRLDIYLFNKLKTKTGGKYLWLRNNVATVISQCVENFLFYVIAFAGEFDFSDILVMTATCCIIEVIVALCDTPFLYLSTKFCRIKDINSEEV